MTLGYGLILCYKRKIFGFIIEIKMTKTRRLALDINFCKVPYTLGFKL